MVDIAKIAYPDAFENGRWIDIVDPVTDGPTGIRICVASHKSWRVRQVRLGGKSWTTTPSAWEMEEYTAKVIASAVVDWSDVEVSGKPLPCTPENIETLLSLPNLLFLREQIDEAADDDAAFWATRVENSGGAS